MKLIAIVLTSVLAVLVAAKNKDKDYDAVLMWPSTGPAALKATFGKFRTLSSYSGQHDFTEDVTVENVSPKNIPFASFTVYLLDKDQVRIADTTLQVKDLGPGQQVKQPLQFHASGVPASVSLVARSDLSGIPTSLKTIPIKIISVPSGAKLRIDGQDAGFTPYTARLAIGSHTLEFNKEGYAAGSTPLEVAADEAPGGSITFELGGLSKDTVELRDGTVLLCDVLSMSISQITVRVAGQEQTYDRNRVKKIILVEREITQTPVVIQPPTKQ
ncbi:MAG: PEGA domain-containing protein [Candidatus Korobacteraceae bacterium]